MLSQVTRRVLATTERELLEIENEIFQLQHSITTTQEVISLNLARSRNRLQTLELFASVAALSFGVGAFGAGILGMNLEDGKNPVFQLEGLFWPTTGALTASCGVVMVGCWIAFRRSANLAGLRAGKGDNVAAFTASLAGHDLSYAFVSQRTYAPHVRLSVTAPRLPAIACAHVTDSRLRNRSCTLPRSRGGCRKPPPRKRRPRRPRPPPNLPSSRLRKARR